MDNYVTKGGSEQRSKRLKARRVIPSMLATTELKKEDTTSRTAKIAVFQRPVLILIFFMANLISASFFFFFFFFSMAVYYNIREITFHSSCQGNQ